MAITTVTPPVVPTSVEMPPPPGPLETPNKKNKFIFKSLLFLLALILAGGLLAGGYYFGMKNQTQPPIPSPTPSPAPTEFMPSIIPTKGLILNATPSAAAKKTITAGLGTSATIFKLYTIDVADGWTDKEEKTDITDKLILTKNTYNLSIYQAPMGGGGCTFGNEPDQQMAQHFSNFVGITGINAEFRRSWNTMGTFTICQKSTSDGSYGSPTSFGGISVASPATPDSATMAEIDAMIASLKNK